MVKSAHAQISSKQALQANFEEIKATAIPKLRITCHQHGGESLSTMIGNDIWRRTLIYRTSVFGVHMPLCEQCNQALTSPHPVPMP